MAMGKKRMALEEIRNEIAIINERIRRGDIFGTKIESLKKQLDERVELLRVKDLPMNSFFILAPEKAKPYANEHACRLKDPGNFERFARKNCYRRVADKCLDFIFGIKGNTSKVQAYRYKLNNKWTAVAARAHCKNAGGKFEAATEKEEIGERIKDEGSV